eukprot:803757_1
MERRVGLPTDGQTRWRCDICSLLNIYSNDECSRCKEPMTKERKQRNLLLPQKSKRSQSTSIHSTSSSSTSASSSNPSSRRSSVSIQSAGKSIISHKNPQKKPRKRGKNNTFGFSSKNKGKTSKVPNNGDYKMKKLRKEDLSEKHLGYKSKKKRNVNGLVRSKLNHDTASYRAKFEGKGNPNDVKRVIKGMKKGVQYATINDLTKNGFQTTLSKKNKSSSSNVPHKKTNSRFKSMSESTKTSIRKLNDERPVTPPPRGCKQKGGKRTLIDRLQKAHTGEIMANLRQGGRYMRPQKKRMGSGTTVYEL